MVKVTKFLGEFSIAHRLMRHEGKCRFLHGHNYRVELTAYGNIGDNGFVVDFAELKKLKHVVERWDHKVVLKIDDPLAGVLIEGGFREHVFIIHQDPTVEVLALHWFAEMKECFEHESARLDSLRVWETNTSYAEARNS